MPTKKTTVEAPAAQTTKRRGGSSDNLPVDYEALLKQHAVIASDMEANVSSGRFFSTQGGILKFNGNPVQGNKIACIIADYILENVYYTDFDPGNPAPPNCYALGRNEDDLAPHEKVDTPENETCKGCPMNEWESAEKGRGKACKNTRRLALIPAGNIDHKTGDINYFDVDSLADQQHAFLRLPVTSIKGWAAYVKNVSGTLNLPPHGVFTLVTVVPDPDNQFVVTFEMLGKVPKGLLPVVFSKHNELQQPGGMDFPYPARTEVETKVRKGAAGKGAKASTKPRPKSKYA
jgi:hypothetical protein